MEQVAFGIGALLLLYTLWLYVRFRRDPAPPGRAEISLTKDIKITTDNLYFGYGLLGLVMMLLPRSLWPAPLIPNDLSTDLTLTGDKGCAVGKDKDCLPERLPDGQSKLTAQIVPKPDKKGASHYVVVPLNSVMLASDSKFELLSGQLPDWARKGGFQILAIYPDQLDHAVKVKPGPVLDTAPPILPQLQTALAAKSDGPPDDRQAPQSPEKHP